MLNNACFRKRDCCAVIRRPVTRHRKKIGNTWLPDPDNRLISPAGKYRFRKKIFVEDQDEEIRYRRLFDSLNAHNLRRAMRVSAADPVRMTRFFAANPALLLTGIRMLIHMKKSERTRRKHEAEGLIVPPLLLLSITGRCNISCSGCYMKQRTADTAREMDLAALRAVVAQADELGISAIVLLGGEPLLRLKDIISLATEFPVVLFPLFTNGLLIDREVTRMIAGCPNIIPFISFEGFRIETDTRRGSGVYDRLLLSCSFLSERVPFFGCTVTVTQENTDVVLSDEFIRTILGTGARALAFIQYVPTEPGTAGLVPTPEQRRKIQESQAAFNRTYPAFFMAAPGDVEMFGGCLAAGRGFVHVSPSGDLEPCTMVPCSDANLRHVPLREALRSRFLETIRRSHRNLRPDGHCALRTNREWVLEMLSRK